MQYSEAQDLDRFSIAEATDEIKPVPLLMKINYHASFCRRLILGVSTLISFFLTCHSAENTRQPPFDVSDKDFVSAFGSSISNRLIVAHATRAWRGDAIRALIGVNGSKEMAQVCLKSLDAQLINICSNILCMQFPAFENSSLDLTWIQIPLKYGTPDLILSFIRI